MEGTATQPALANNNIPCRHLNRKDNENTYRLNVFCTCLQSPGNVGSVFWLATKMFVLAEARKLGVEVDSRNLIVLTQETGSAGPSLEGPPGCEEFLVSLV